jgi:hypothetical protein
MNDLLGWISEYSPAVVIAIAGGAAVLFVVRLIVERAVGREFDRNAKVFDALLRRRSAFEEKILTERFESLTGLYGRLQRVTTNVNRLRHGKPAPADFLVDGEIVPLTGIFDDITIERLVLGETYHEQLNRLARIALRMANAESDAWTALSQEWESVATELRAKVEADFGVADIRW